MAVETEKVLKQVADAFKELADRVNSPTPSLEVDLFVRACRLVSPVIGFLGIAFQFAEIEFRFQVDDIAEASKTSVTLEELIDLDIQQERIMMSTSHSRHLIRVKRAIQMLRIVFEQILSRSGDSIVGPVSTGYEQVFAPYHGHVIRTAVTLAIAGSLPTKAELLTLLNETEDSANVQMQNFVDASFPIIQYIDNLFHSRESGDELLGLI